MVSRAQIRSIFLAAVVVLSLYGLSGVLSADGTGTSRVAEEMEKPFAEREELVPDRDGITVITGNGIEGASSIFAFAPNGRVLYANDTLDYGDVDPVPNTSHSVIYTAQSNSLGPERQAACDGRNDENCTVQIIERVNLSTGETTRLFTEVKPARLNVHWHDIDHLSGETYVVGDIHNDRVFTLNLSTGLIGWEYSVHRDFPITGGGPYPGDWTHLNDVEVLPDGRIMVSLRNQDQVIFLSPESGLLANQTLGAEDDYSVLYEQHNPDYIPEARGGPAVVVADSQNNRVVEYQRQNGTWNRTWIWSDVAMQWPRDADRLPNGHTLIVDANSNRVIEVDETGEIVWKIPFYRGYDVERLSTGDESAGGPSATEAGIESRNLTDATDASVGVSERILGTIKTVLPSKIVNGLAFINPPGLVLRNALALYAAALVVLCWGGLEYRWSRYSLKVNWPFELGEKR